MSIVKANGLATKASSTALDATRAAEKCNSDRAALLVAQAQMLIQQAEEQRRRHKYTFSDAERLDFELDVAANVRTLLAQARGYISEAEGRIEQCRRAEQGICIAKEAVAAAKACDAARARRLAEASGTFIDSLDVIFRLRIRRLAIGRRLAAARKSLEQIEALLRDCAKKEPIYPFKESGTFKGTRAGLASKATVFTGEKNRIEFVFDADKELDCDSICLLTVQHYEDLGKCGKVVDPPDAGRRGGEAGLFTPLDRDAADGYVVDTNPRAKCPCLPSKVQGLVEIKRPKGGGRAAGSRQGIRGFDEPNDVGEGFECCFETAAVCFKVTKRSELNEVLAFQITVLQTMHWVLTRNKDSVLESRILKNGRAIDWGAPSLPFQKALRKWLKVEGRGPCPPGFLKKRSALELSKFLKLTPRKTK